MSEQNQGANTTHPSGGTGSNDKQEQPLGPSSLEFFEKIVDRAHTEIESVRSVYVWLAGSLAVIFGVCLSWFLYFNGNNWKEMKSTVNDSVYKMKADVNEIGVRVNRRIDQEFDKPSIQSLIEEKARQQVEEVAVPLIEQIIESQISDHINPVQAKVVDAQQRVIDLQESLAKAKQEQALLEREISILRLFFSVRRGDRKAFGSLKAMTEQSSGSDRELAISLMEDIRDYYESLKFSPYHKVVVDALKRHKNPPAEQIYSHISDSNAPAGLRKAHINEINERKLYYFVEDLVTLVGDANDLKIAAEAARVISELSGEDFACVPPFESVLNWWVSEGSKLKKYQSPFDAVEKCQRLYESGKKNEALEGFLNIVDGRQGLAGVRVSIAMIYVQNGEPEKAIEQVRMAQAESQGHLPSARLLARLLTMQGDKTGAIKVIQRNVMPFAPPDVDMKRLLREDKSLRPLYDQEEFRALVGIDPNGVPLKERE